MRFGVCASVSDAQLLKHSGYDYIELSVAGDLMPEADEAEWLESRRKIEAMPLIAETFNSFVRTGKIVGPEANPERLKRYVHTAFTRASQVGGKVIVFGSGGARSIPDEYSPDVAIRQTLDFLGYCADAYTETGVVLAIEPLCIQECNYINLVLTGAALAKECGREGILNLADTYHMEMMQEPLSAIYETRDVLAHVHTADTGRFAPGTGEYDHTALFAVLASSDYDGRVSIECSWQDRLAELAVPALEHLRSSHKLALSRFERRQ